VALLLIRGGQPVRYPPVKAHISNKMNRFKHRYLIN
jgi:hypothetical protein